jgi:hypothetical protein
MTEQPIKVTLVHGTFARKAKWIRGGSPMTNALDAAGIAHQEFVWSGGNSHRARIKAAEELSDRLGCEREHEPGVRQAVVAHSHGGNVALHAVWRLRQVRDGSVPVVALATPFLFANRKKVHSLVLAAAGLSAAVIFLAGIGLVLLLALEGPREEERWWLTTFTCALWVIVVAQLIGLGYWWARHGRPWDRHAQDRFIGLVQAPHTAGGGLLVVRAADDEASTGLALAQLAAWLAATAARLSRPQNWGAVYTVLTVIGVVLAVFADSDVEELWLLVVVTAVTVAFLLSFALVSVPALFTFSHGPDGPTASLFALVSAEAAPPGKHDVIQRPIRDEPTKQEPQEKRGLSHSSLYDDEEVIRCVIEHVQA